jgi:transcriptional regulator with XRE-family HTH domain
MYESSGALLWEQRTAKGLTQAELAEASGVPERTIRRIETGENEKPQSETVRKLAKALGVRYAALLGREWEEAAADSDEGVLSVDPFDLDTIMGEY